MSMARACRAHSLCGSMRGYRALLPFAAICLIGAAPVSTPLGTAFHRLSQGRTIRATLPADTRRVAIYYGASWCGPCRAFVPELIAAYPRLRARGVEVLFVSDDATCAAALDYARVSRMPWLLLPCDRQRRRHLRMLGGKALPGIVVVDRQGRQVADSWEPDDHSRPRRILNALLSAPSPAALTVRRYPRRAGRDGRCNSERCGCLAYPG